jgi:hypothetical protein
MIEDYDVDLNEIETSALLANIPYLINSGRTIEEIQAQLNEYDIDYTIDSDLTDEFSAVAFNDKNVIQAIRGTASINDLVSDVGIATNHPLGGLLGVGVYAFGKTVGNTSLEARLKREYEKNDKINEKYADKQQTLIGHSLGGIAETIGRQRKVRTIGFNPAPQSEQSPPHPDSVIYRTFFDPVSAFSTSRDKERIITVPAKSFDTHGLINFLPDDYKPPNNLISNNILKENDNTNYKMDIQRTYGIIPTNFEKLEGLGTINTQPETDSTQNDTVYWADAYRDAGLTDAQIERLVSHSQPSSHALDYADIVDELAQTNEEEHPQLMAPSITPPIKKVRTKSLAQKEAERAAYFQSIKDANQPRTTALPNTRANAERVIGRRRKPQTQPIANRDAINDKGTAGLIRRPTAEVIEEVVQQVVADLYAGTGRHNNIPSTIKTGMTVFSQRLDPRRHTNLGMSPNKTEPILETLSHNDFCKIFPKRCEIHKN